MTADQKQKVEEIARRWHSADTAKMVHVRAILDIGYLTGVIMMLQQELELEVNAHREDLERSAP